jgi:hypothetical protein
MNAMWLRMRVAVAAAVIGTAGLAGAQTTVLATGHPESEGAFGIAVSSVPDVNGDGIDDIVVGAFNQKVGTILGAGRVTIHSGFNGTILRVLTSPNKQTLGWFGGSVAGVPDVNSDFRGDVLVGAYNETNTGAPDTGQGRAYLFNGSTGVLMRTFTSPNPEQGGSFGRAVAGLVDLTGDLRGDVVIGAYHEDPNAAPDNAGRVYVFNGLTGTLFKTLVSFNQAANGSFGVSVAAVPDVTGDGRQDVVIGATGESPSGITGAGRAYIYNPFSGLLFKTFTSATPEAFGQFGISVAGVPDVNGDARGDVIVGAPFEGNGVLDNTGKAYLFSGANGVRLRSFFSGAPEAGDLFGTAVAGLIDMNGDGRGDIAIGAAHADPGAAPNDSGRGYVYSGATGAFLRGLGSTAPVASAAFGTSICGIADVNDNAKGDLVVGSPFEDTPNLSNVGRAFLFRN